MLLMREMIAELRESKTTYYLRHSVVSNKLKRDGRFLRITYFFRDPEECAQLFIVELHLFIIRSKNIFEESFCENHPFFQDK